MHKKCDIKIEYPSHLDSRSQECEKAKTSAKIVSVFMSILYGMFSILLRFVGVMNLILILSCPICIRRRETYSREFVKNVNADLYLDIYESISFKLGMIIETTKLYIFISVCMTLTFIQGHCCMSKKKKIKKTVCVHFFAKSAVDLDEVQYVATTSSFVEAHAKFMFHTYYSRERSLLT